jgi:hypothetical protein
MVLLFHKILNTTKCKKSLPIIFLFFTLFCLEEVDKMQKPNILGMIWRPHIEFERIQLQPIVWLPLTIISILHVIGMLLVTRVKTEEWLINSVQTPPTISYTYMSIPQLFSDLTTFLLSICIVALFVFLISKLLKKSVTFTKAFSLSIFLQVIPTLGLLLQAIAHVLEWEKNIFRYSLQDALHLSSGHLSFVFGFLTIFTIWNWVLSAVGLRKVMDLSPIAATLLPLVIWYLPVLISSFFVTPQG